MRLPRYFAALLTSLIMIVAVAPAAAQDCSTSNPRYPISPAIAAKHPGLISAGPGGSFSLRGLDAQARQAGGLQRYLSLARNQVESNQQWFNAMSEHFRRGDPLLINQPVNVPDTYNDARDVHAINIAQMQWAECMLGMAPSQPAMPPTAQTLMAERDAMVAARDAEQRRQAEAAQSRASFLQGLSNVLGAVGAAAGAMSGASGAGYSSGGGNCGWGRDTCTGPNCGVC